MCMYKRDYKSAKFNGIVSTLNTHAHICRDSEKDSVTEIHALAQRNTHSFTCITAQAEITFHFVLLVCDKIGNCNVEKISIVRPTISTSNVSRGRKTLKLFAIWQMSFVYVC